jgi:phosphatidylserine synthase
MVSTIRFRSFKTIDLRTRRPYRVLLLIAAGIMLIAWLHRYVLVVMAYAYLASPFLGMAMTRFRQRGGRVPPVDATRPSADAELARDTAAG